MQKVFSWEVSERKGDDSGQRIMKESTMSTGNDNTFGRSSANERKQTDSKGNHTLEYETEEDEGDVDDDEEEEEKEEDDDEDNEEEDQGKEKTVEYPGGKLDSPKVDMRIESVDGDSFDDDDDDRRSSACSEAINRDGDFSGLPPDLHLLLPTKYSTLDRNFKLQSKAESLVEALEKQRRQTVGNRLKELQTTTAKTRPMTPDSAMIREMPIIARRSPSRDAVLPKQTTQRRSRNYESVIVGPFFSKSKPSALHRRLQVGGSLESNGRRHSAKGQRETGDPRGTEHRSNSPRCYLPMGDGDRGHSGRPLTGNAVLRDVSAAAAAAAAAENLNSQSSSPMGIGGKKSDDDDTSPKQRTGCQGRVANGNERKQFHGDKLEEAESVRKTDRSKESGNETERSSSVTTLPRLSSSSNGDLSFGGIASRVLPPSTDDLEMSHSTRHSSDNRTSGPASRDTDNNLLHSDFNTTETTACTSKIRDNLTDTFHMDYNTALHSNTDTLNEDEAKYKASGGHGDFIQKTNSARTVETKKYYSDIRIRLKEAEPVFPVSYRSSEVTQVPNGGVPGVSSSKEREVDEESEISENVTPPNWSSYPGPLLNASAAHESEDEDAIGIIGKNTSDVNCADADADADADTEAKYNKLSNADCFVREISTPSTKADDRQTNQTKTKDSDPERCSYVHPNAAERTIGSDKHLQPSAVFVSYNYKPTNTKRISDHRSACDGGSPRCRSTERREAYLVESHSVNRRTLTRDSKSTRSASNNPSGRRSEDDDGSCTERSFAEQNNGPALTARRSRQDSSIGAVNKLFSEQENAGTATHDRLKKQSSGAVRLIRDGGVSGSANLRWESSATRIDDQKTGERFKSSSRSRSSEKTTSIDRLWQSIEEPHPRLLRRKIRFEPEPGSSPSSTDKSSSRWCRAFSCDGGAVDVDAAPIENGVHRQNTLSEEKHEFSLLEIEVPKVGIGLGFCIEGGKDGPYGDRPITVKRLFRGSSDPTPSAVSVKLCPGDEIVSANGRNMTLLSRYVAWNYLKTLPEGTIRLVVRRQH